MAHKYHIHVGSKGHETIRMKLEEETVQPRVPLFITPCNTHCDEEMGVVTEPIETAIFQAESWYLARDKEDLAQYLERRKNDRTYRFVAVDLPKEGFYLEKDIVDLINEKEAENLKEIEECKSLITVQDFHEDIRAEVLRRNRKRKGVAVPIDYGAIRREKEEQELAKRLKEAQ